jgi:hypothetical membrane protein
MGFKDTITQKYEDLLAWLARQNQKIEGFFTDPLNMRFAIIIVLIGYHALLIIGYIFAQWNETFTAIDGYNLLDNWISDLGGSPFTPLPILYDVAACLAGAFTLPLTFFLEKQIAPVPAKLDDLKGVSRWRYRFSTLGFLFGLIGNIGYILVGVFSEDRNYWGMHMYSSALAFGGFVGCGLFFGICIVLYDDIEIPNAFGWYMIFIPPITMIGQGLPLVTNNMISGPFMEWMLLFSVLIWVDPLAIRLLLRINKERATMAAEIAKMKKMGGR